jgi:hypothetical protein
MSQYDLERVRSDLDTIEAAIGVSPPQPSNEIRINSTFAVAGVAAVTWALVVTGPTHVAAFTFFLVPLTVWLFTAVRGNLQEHYVLRDRRAAFRTVFLALPLAALFFWCRSVGLSPAHFLGLSVFLVGIALFCGAVTRPDPNYVCWSVALMTGGLLVPLGGASPVLILSGALGLGGLFSALVLSVNYYRFRNHAAN